MRFPRFSEDPTEQNRLNVRHALKKANSGMQLSDADSKLLIDNGLDDFVRGGQTLSSWSRCCSFSCTFSS